MTRSTASRSAPPAQSAASTSSLTASARTTRAAYGLRDVTPRICQDAGCDSEARTDRAERGGALVRRPRANLRQAGRRQPRLPRAPAADDEADGPARPG